ncbi:MAG: hypothetical protein IM631_21985 [Cytophagales bacterium]|nr:hypothetical protein [Cytophagales bacterium]MCA6374033.1 hypothetical protein [Cytophagales bacterium]MCA6376435.1 hypothetical protein [Cytophagales bacterium]MCA6386101.1 hypothetical protein [Cytophagales bacterium]
MTKSNWTILLAVTIISCGRTQNIDELKKKYIFDDFKVYIEKTSTTDNNADRYTIDNKAYKLNRKFIFDYYIIKGKDTLKITSPKMTGPDSDFQREWSFTSKSNKHEDKIETISITVLPGISNDNQTMLKYEYQYFPDLGYSTFSSTSGVIENEMNTWMHPHRDKYFMILELNPFPFIQQPFKIGNKWTWTLGIGDHWKDDRWKTWTGSIRNNYEYEIIGKEKLKTKIGEMDCWVVQSTATSSIGSTGLIGYYDEENGFVKLDYINIDKSRLKIEIREIK